MKNRASNIELLKVIAIFIILLSHSTPRYELIYPFNGVVLGGNLNYVVDPNSASTDIHNIFIQFFISLGQVGNAIFIICSSWFLYEVGRVKRDKIWFLISSTLLISLFSFAVLGFVGWSFDIKALFYSLFPVATYNNWFVCCYLQFYLMNPILKVVGNSLSKRSCLLIIILGMFAFSLWNMIFSTAFLYFHLAQFILIYFIVVYFKRFIRIDRYSSNKALLWMSIGFIGLFIHTIIVNYVSVYLFQISIFQNSLNPWILIIGFSSFFLFSNYNFQNKVINYISSLSLLVYLIDENYVVRTTLKPYFWYCSLSVGGGRCLKFGNQSTVIHNYFFYNMLYSRHTI